MITNVILLLLDILGDLSKKALLYKDFYSVHQKPLNPLIEITEIEESQGALFNILKQITLMPDA
ncbi:hypothetical protein [Enterococcus sp. DIV0876]|uniref:hypothetical protein n=1 Tax=Enterococcus sp. DIV0876 TaxID=2774633 RepID=UPI003D2FD0FD